MNLFQNQHKDDAVSYSLAKVGGDFKLSRNFRLYEFQSDTDLVLIHPAMVLVCQHLRVRFGKVVRINSGYRSPEHNRRVGGRPASLHLFGLAADVDVVGVHPSDVYAELDGLQVGGLGRYDTFTHVDVWGVNRRWDFSTGANVNV